MDETPIDCQTGRKSKTRLCAAHRKYTSHSEIQIGSNHVDEERCKMPTMSTREMSTLATAEIVCKGKSIVRDKEMHLLTIKGSLFREDKTIVNIYVINTEAKMHESNA